jgi:hypothetical protein
MARAAARRARQRGAQCTDEFAHGRLDLPTRGRWQELERHHPAARLTQQRDRLGDLDQSIGGQVFDGTCVHPDPVGG